MNSFLRNASFWEKSKEPRKKKRRERERREKITPLIMATMLAPLVHALRLNQDFGVGVVIIVVVIVRGGKEGQLPRY